METLLGLIASLTLAYLRSDPSNQSMKPTPPLRGKFSVLATAPCRGLSLSR